MVHSCTCFSDRTRDGDPPPNHFGTREGPNATSFAIITRNGPSSSQALRFLKANGAIWAHVVRGGRTARFIRGAVALSSRAMGRDIRITHWDAVVFARAAAVAGLALALAWLVTAATDEGGVPWGERAGRTLPLTPICAAIGAWGALAPVRARGEARALEALGRNRSQIAAAAVAGGAAVALVASIAVGVVRTVDVAGFYPTAVRTSAWQWQNRAFVNRTLGLQVDAEGTLERTGPSTESAPLLTIPPAGRAAAALATGVAGVALPMLLAHLLLGRRASAASGGKAHRPHPADRLPAALASAATVAASVLLFQAAAARLVPALFAALPPVALLAFAFGLYRVSP